VLASSNMPNASHIHVVLPIETTESDLSVTNVEAPEGELSSSSNQMYLGGIEESLLPLHYPHTRATGGCSHTE
jgi:hypothetical protein